MHLRPLQAQDEKAVVAIMNAAIIDGKNAYNVPLSEEDGHLWFIDLQASAMQAMALVNEDDEPCGWGRLSPYRGGRGGLSHVAEITFYLSPEVTMQGWGHLLVGALEAATSKHQVSALVAILLSSNANSIRFLEKRGYALWANFEGLVQRPDGELDGHMYMGKSC